MTDYLRAEIYRMLHKKSMYIYFACFAAGYSMLAFSRVNGASYRVMLDDAENLFGLLPIAAGGYLFTALYGDDLNSRNLAVLIGSGLSKTKIVLSKLVLTAVFDGALFGMIPLFMSGVYSVLGLAPAPEVFAGVCILALRAYLIVVAVSAISGVVAYGFQRTTFCLAAYLLLSVDIENQPIIQLADGIATGAASLETVLAPAAGYALLVSAVTALAILAFHKKELEF